MFLFIIGIGLPDLVLLFLLLFVFGLLISWVTKKILRRTMKEGTDQRIKFLSRLSAFILSPILVIGALLLTVYISMKQVPQKSDEEIVSNHYQLMEEDIKEDLKPGMSKTEVVKLFGEVDTTQAILIYDLSLPEAKEKYILEITFDQDGLKNFTRKR